VALLTDLRYGELANETFVETFLPNSTYTYQDDNQPSLVRSVFSTSAGSGSSSGSSSPGGSSSGSTSSGKISGAAQSNTAVVGSAAKTATSGLFRGSLAGTVTSAGKLTLTRNGKGVGTLKAGRYSITVDDKTAKAGFTVQEIRKPSVALTGVSFVGKHTGTVDLKTGQWISTPRRAPRTTSSSSPETANSACHSDGASTATGSAAAGPSRRAPPAAPGRLRAPT
jgi:hypothetical protein